MNRFSAIDLSKLPPPDVIETLDYDAVLSDALQRMAALMPEVTDALALESEPLRKLIELISYLVLLLRARINDAARATMLATATGADLDNLAALLGVERLVVTPASDTAPAVMESDAALRARAQLAPEAYTTAGPIGAYEYHARSADARVADVSVTTPEPGSVLVTVLGVDGDGTPAPDLLATVQEALGADDVRPLCANVIVAAPQLVNYSVAAEITVGTGPDAGVVLAAAQTAAAAYVQATRRLGATVARSGLMAALHQAEVLTVAMPTPAVDIVCGATSAPHCTEIAITMRVLA